MNNNRKNHNVPVHPNRVDVITMGCSKNLVDSERLTAMLEAEGFSARHNPRSVRGSGHVVINTCGFIGDAKEESIEMILNCLRYKEAGLVGEVTVMGCLSQRYLKELSKELPEVDNWYGKFDWKGIVENLRTSGTPRNTATGNGLLRTVSTGHHAYIKISEGCNRFCAFCAIPLITGRMRSRAIEDIVSEVTGLVEQGIHEFNIIAQDLSSYGKDIYGKSALATLLEKVSDIKGVDWIRLHYAYPADFPYDILPVMASRPNICKYLDIALQHSNDKVLSNMRRHITGEQTRQLIQRIRCEVPGIHIRTTMMTGFPGEGEQEFSEMMDFVKEMRFERMGAFAYCEEEDTYAARNFEDTVPQELKQERLDKLMALQEEISLEINQAKIGQRMTVVCDGSSQDGQYYVCRSQFDSPEVDPEVLVTKEKCRRMIAGHFYEVEITDALPYDLIAKMLPS